MEQMLPAEIQAQLAQAQQRQQLAQLLLQQSLARAQQPTEYTPGKYGRAVPVNPIAALLGLGTMVNANRGMSEAAAEQGRILGDFENQTQNQLRELYTGGKERLTEFLASKNPRVRLAAEMLRKEQEERDKWLKEKLSSVASTAGNYNAASNILTGQQNTFEDTYKPGIQFSTSPKGDVLASTTNRKGEIDFKFAPKEGTTVNVGDKNEAKALIDLNAKDLETLKDNARAAQKTLGNVARIVSEFERGAQTGAGQNWILQAQKFANLLGAKFDTTAPTETIKTALMEGVLGKAQALRPVSNDEVKFLQQMVGSIDTDPQALANLLAWYNANALYEIQTFQNQLGEMASAASPELAARYRTVGVGVNLPKDVQGPPWFKFKTYELLKLIGGEEALAPFGFEPGAKFDIRGPRTGLVKSPTKPVKELSTEELIKQLTEGKK